MKDRNVILKILDETKIINSALEAENVEILVSALNNREQLYKEYDTLPSSEKDILKSTMTAEIEKIQKLDQQSIKLFKKVNDGLKNKFNQNAAKKARLKKGGVVNKKYRNPYAAFTVGKFDAKL